jgi:pimeloyl-ACP methyl ester carboxylesterase
MRFHKLQSGLKLPGCTVATRRFWIPLVLTMVVALSGYGRAQQPPSADVVELVDPLSELISEGRITSNPETLASKGILRSGVVTDGVTQLVVRLHTLEPGVACFSLVDQNGTPLTTPEENGALSNIPGLPGNGTCEIPTTTTSQGEQAFVLYTTAARFVRELHPDDANIAERNVFLNISIDRGGMRMELPLRAIRLRRPPIVLVHGLGGSGQSWARFNLTARANDCRDEGGYYVCAADYDTNQLRVGGFHEIAPAVGTQIRGFLARFRRDTETAALQASVIAHSMGGNVVRTLPLCGTLFDCPAASYRRYFVDGRLLFGEINKLITIGTPHLGSPLANRLQSKRGLLCRGNEITVDRYVTFLGIPVGNGIENLQVKGPAITLLNRNPSEFPIHFVAGIASANDEALARANGGIIPIINSCRGDILPTTVGSIFNGVKSDLIVSVTSQRKGLPENAQGTSTSRPNPHLGEFGFTIHNSALAVQGEARYSRAELVDPDLGLAVRRILNSGPFIMP